jgi:hypothetical protein
MSINEIASDTFNTMLLQQNTSLRPVDRSHVRVQNGETSRSDEVPVTSAARRALERGRSVPRQRPIERRGHRHSDAKSRCLPRYAQR